ncbi:MAG: DmsE family decaheme c-type cytochrome [Micropepsaceae bacterium]
MLGFWRGVGTARASFAFLFSRAPSAEHHTSMFAAVFVVLIGIAALSMALAQYPDAAQSAELGLPSGHTNIDGVALTRTNTHQNWQVPRFSGTPDEGSVSSRRAGEPGAVVKKKKSRRIASKHRRTSTRSGTSTTQAAASTKPETKAEQKPDAHSGADPEADQDDKASAKSPKSPAGPPTFVGSQKCMTCHVSQAETFSKTLMGQIFLKSPRSDREKLGCEACHGPGSAHVTAGGAEDTGGPGLVTFDADSPRPVEERNKVCLGCHENDQRTHWRGSAHETRGLACTSCHQIMDKASPRFQLIKSTEIDTCTQCHKDRRAQLWRSSHMPVREGKLKCTSCHNPHGTPNQKLLREATVNDTCYTCHAEKRGPFLFEHAPSRDNCLSCHEPHGSMHERLLTVSRPRLCQQCHSEEDHPSDPHNPNALFAFRGGCANCHGGSIHGSNSPSGAQLHR